MFPLLALLGTALQLEVRVNQCDEIFSEDKQDSSCLTVCITFVYRFSPVADGNLRVLRVIPEIEDIWASKFLKNKLKKKKKIHNM